MWYRKWLFLNPFIYKWKSTDPVKSVKKNTTKRLRSFLALESLEERVVPTAITWKNPNGGNWDLGSNWVGGVAPGSGDTAVIDTAGTATITIQSSDNIQVESVTTNGNVTLSISGGSLEVTSGASTLSGALSMSGGSLRSLERKRSNRTLVSLGFTSVMPRQ